MARLRALAEDNEGEVASGGDSSLSHKCAFARLTLTLILTPTLTLTLMPSPSLGRMQ